MTVIKFKNGLVDSRRVLKTYHVGLRRFALVIGEIKGEYTNVLIEDYYSSSPTDQIYGASLIESVEIDATPDDILEYRRHYNIIQKGDIVEVVRGRKYLGCFKRIAYVFDIKKNHQAFTYVGFTDGTKVSLNNIKLIKGGE